MKPDEREALTVPLEPVVGPLYAERDVIAQGLHYSRHVEAMTAEGLHSKADIAAELAHRDLEIERLRSALILLTPENWREDEEWTQVLNEHGLTPNSNSSAENAG